MPNRWTKKLPLLALSAALLLTCCACAAQAEEEKGETAAKTAGTEAYSLTLPATITAKEQENNTLTLFLDGTEVGGVAVIAYENAAALDLDSLGDGHAEKELNQILQLVAPEGHVDHMFESYGEDGYLSLSLVPCRTETSRKPSTTSSPRAMRSMTSCSRQTQSLTRKNSFCWTALP